MARNHSSGDSPGDGEPTPSDSIEPWGYPAWMLLLVLGLGAVAAGTVLFTLREWGDLGFGLVILGLLGLLMAYRRYQEGRNPG